MTVRVLFFSVLRDLVGKPELEVELQAGSVVADLLNEMGEQYPELKKWDEKLLISVDHAYAERGAELSEGNEVAIMPPVQGG